MTNSQGKPQHSLPGFHIMAKPVGPACNLNCEYCFYTEKEALFPPDENYRMSAEVLETFIRKYITAQPLSEVEFVWQGGEPTLMGLGFFRKVIELQKTYGQGKRITNCLQTNGTLFNDEWCKFLARHNFLVGLSLDGPEEIHNRYRKDRAEKSTFQDVLRGLKLMQKHGVEFNALACVAKETAGQPLEVYHFFKEHGVRFIQFLPIVERTPDSCAKELGLRLGVPTTPSRQATSTAVTPWTVEPKAYGDFLIAILEEWVRHDVGQIFVMNFEWALSAWRGTLSTTCSFSPRCGRCAVIEHNGDIYACDHYVYPQYRLGNIVTDSLKEMIESPRQRVFGAEKETALPRYCRDCEVQFACRGGCPKQRFCNSPFGEPGWNYLCGGYKKFFRHIHKYMKAMAKLLEHGLPAAKIMEAVERPLAIKLDN